MTQRENSAAEVARVMLEAMAEERRNHATLTAYLEERISDARRAHDVTKRHVDEERAKHAELLTRAETAEANLAAASDTIAALRVSLDTAAKTCESLRADRDALNVDCVDLNATVARLKSDMRALTAAAAVRGVR